MKNLAFFATVLFALSAFAGDPPIPKITGPTNASVGEIIIIDASQSAGMTGATPQHYNWLVDTSEVTVPLSKDGPDLAKLVSQLRASGFSVQAPADGQPMTYMILEGNAKILLASYPGTWKISLAVGNEFGVRQIPWKVVVKKDGTVPIPNPDPGPGPTPQPGPVTFGLSEQVPGWLATVPQSARSNIPSIVEALKGNAAACASNKFGTVGEAETALTVVLLSAVQNRTAWLRFGTSLNDALTNLKSAGRIVTPQDFGKAITEVAVALEGSG